MGPDSMRGILPQTPTALLVIKEQVSSTQAVHLHMFQLPKIWIALQYVHNHPHVPRKCRGTGPTRAVHHCHLQHHDVFFHWHLTCPFSNICKHIRQPLHGKLHPWLSGEYISPKSLHLAESITGAQQLSVVIYKSNL